MMTGTFDLYSSVLVFAHSGIGDTVMLLPLLRALREADPCLTIACTAHPQTAQILEMADLHVEVVPWPKNWRKEPIALLRGLRDIKTYRPEILIVPPGINPHLASWVARMSGSAERLAFLAEHGAFHFNVSSFHLKAFTHVFPRMDYAHKVDQFSCVLDFFGLPALIKKPTLRIEPDVIRLIRERLLAEARLCLLSEEVICTHFGCEPVNRARLWPLPRMVRALESVCKESGRRCLVLWGPNDVDLVHEAQWLARNEDWFVPLPWKATLKEVAGLLGMTKILVSNDCGIAHIAAAVGAKVVAIFGPTDPRFHGPYGRQSTVLYRKVSCGPCYPREHYFRCPYGRECLSGISENSVVDATVRLLNDDFPAGEHEISNGVFWASSPLTRPATLSSRTSPDYEDKA